MIKLERLTRTLNELSDGGSSTWSYTYNKTAAEKHLDELKKELKECKNKRINLFNPREIMTNMSRMKELTHQMKNHKSIFPEYYL